MRSNFSRREYKRYISYERQSLGCKGLKIAMCLEKLEQN
ncbi:hypothetical protein FF38_03697 [Lucilia cuprina]|uniref:Uncharacterized protein n=1 Tax=Lucilia cuprina TaxID=7375 RepID=A0A0L0C108_LUCCU|nr:hypothetical protein FF38_03697 [Lucilia cuprina]